MTKIKIKQNKPKQIIYTFPHLTKNKFKNRNIKTKIGKVFNNFKTNFIFVFLSST